jgi:divalent metal cation (Fe/Co/Zn/Cd) transporter
LFAALGLFVAGAAVSVTHGVQELRHPEPATDFIVGYVVLAISFVLEGISFLQSTRQARREAEPFQRDLIEHVLATSDPTLRAVFAEDSAALVGLIIAASALAAHQVTGSSVPDAVGSILIGLLLAWVAGLLINLNRRFLVGRKPTPGACRYHPRPDERARGSPGDLSAARDRRSADGLSHRRCRPDRR